jgi:hypothetical protein
MVGVGVMATAVRDRLERRSNNERREVRWRMWRLTSADKEPIMMTTQHRLNALNRGALTRKSAGLTALLVMAMSGCSSGGQSTAQSSPSPTATTTETATGGQTTSAPQLALVGEWQRATTCQQRVHAFRAAGLGEELGAESAAGDGMIPGVTSVDQLKNPKRPCQGAVPIKHSHFFTADGLFGSRDAVGNQVDNGTYRIIDDHTFALGKVTFHYKILDGDMLKLYPVMPDCAPKGCWLAQWAVAVTYLGLPWKRISTDPYG